jgi:hypothetical protein
MIRRSRRLRHLAGVEKRDHGEHAPVVVVRLGQVELDQDAVDVFLDRPLGDE